MKNSKLYELQPDPFDSSQKKHLRICLFTNVKNSSRLCEMLRAAEIDAAMIKPELVAEIFVLLAAANRAIHQAAHNRLYTRSLSAELVYSLSPTKHISESLKFFGISENSLNLLVATFGDADGKQMKFVAKQIDGITVPLENLGKLVDTSAIKKVYHIPESESNLSTMSDIIVTRIICKDL